MTDIADEVARRLAQADKAHLARQIAEVDEQIAALVERRARLLAESGEECDVCHNLETECTCALVFENGRIVQKPGLDPR